MESREEMIKTLAHTRVITNQLDKKLEELRQDFKHHLELVDGGNKDRCDKCEKRKELCAETFTNIHKSLNALEKNLIYMWGGIIVSIMLSGGRFAVMATELIIKHMSH